MLSRFETALRLFDEANALDPNRIIVNGREQPRELAYARWLSMWVIRLEPGASEALRLAARCQHIRRWEIPRDTFPVGRKGYLKWRSTLALFHAEKSAEILSRAGYGEDTIRRVQDINRKKGLKNDAGVQVMEDALCLVFLEHQIGEFAERHSDEKMTDIIGKTWKKMSGKGRAEALKMSYDERVSKLLKSVT